MPRLRFRTVFLLAAVFVLAVVAMALAVWPPRLLVYAFDARHPEVIFRGPPAIQRDAITARGYRLVLGSA